MMISDAMLIADGLQAIAQGLENIARAIILSTLFWTMLGGFFRA